MSKLKLITVGTDIALGKTYTYEAIKLAMDQAYLPYSTHPDDNSWQVIDGIGCLFGSDSTLALNQLTAMSPKYAVLCHDFYRERQHHTGARVLTINAALKEFELIGCEVLAVSLFGPSHPKDIACTCGEISELLGGLPVFNPAEPNELFLDFLNHLYEIYEDNSNG